MAYFLMEIILRPKGSNMYCSSAHEPLWGWLVDALASLCAPRKPRSQETCKFKFAHAKSNNSSLFTSSFLAALWTAVSPLTSLRSRASGSWYFSKWPVQCPFSHSWWFMSMDGQLQYVVALILNLQIYPQTSFNKRGAFQPFGGAFQPLSS